MGESSITLYLKELVQKLPHKPGVYQYFNEEGKIIYVGKAKNLKKRVSSYFLNKPDQSGKLRILVRNIRDIQHIIVDSEQDALLLENNLIKQYQPRYNVLLKDDKSYPWICIKNEPFPRVFKTRNVIKDGSEYYGPYTSGFMIKTILEFIKQVVKLRTCNYQLNHENIKSGKFKVCLEYHIGNCKAPCVNKQTLQDYSEGIDQVKNILKGNISSVKKALKETMKRYASELMFEEAEEVRKRLVIIENYQSKSTIVSSTISDVDVYAYVSKENLAIVNFLKVVDGAVIQTHSLEIKNTLEESKEEVLGLAITEIQQRMNSFAKEILVPFIPDFKDDNVKYTIPKIGDKKKLLELSERNAKYILLDKQKQSTKLTKSQSSVRILNTLKQDLRLINLPVHIECFDNSNIQGTNPVAACVVFKNAKPAKKDYRHFNIKTVEGPNDFASMTEVVYRRYKRLIEEASPLPQLIIIDGGKGQLGAAIEALDKIEWENNRPAIIGIAKRLEEIYFPGDPVPLYLDKTSESLKLIQQLRDEAHRFGITFHRQKRSGNFIKSELDAIPGIGPKSVEALLNKFGSIQRIKEASEEDISVLLGSKKATVLRNYLKTNK